MNKPRSSSLRAGVVRSARAARVGAAAIGTVRDVGSLMNAVRRSAAIGVTSFRVPALTAVALLVAAVGCSPDEEAAPVLSSPATARASVRQGTPEAPAPASSLAASQVTASTVPRPSVPPRCAPGDVAIWTAQVRPYDGGADAVLRVVNAGDRWCEVDLAGSPRLDPGIEPDVWLEPGEWAELLLGPSGDDCLETDVVTLAQMSIGGETVVIPTTAVAPCGWSLVALFPLDVPAAECRELDAAVTERWLVVRNIGAGACVLSELVAAGDLGVAPRQSTATAVTALEPGDLAGFRLRPSDGCGGGGVPLELAGVGLVAEVVVEPCATVELGPARSVFEGSSGLLGDVDRTPPVDAAAIVAGLDPFAVG